MKALTRAYKFQEDSNEERNLDNNASIREPDIQEMDDMDSVYSLILYNNGGEFITINNSIFVSLVFRKNDIAHKVFEQHYEIKSYSKYDYITESFSSKRFELPKHLVSSLMVEKKIREIRSKCLQTVIFFIEELKTKAYKSYKKKNFNDALIHYSDVSFIRFMLIY